MEKFLSKSLPVAKVVAGASVLALASASCISCLTTETAENTNLGACSEVVSKYFQNYKGAGMQAFQSGSIALLGINESGAREVVLVVQSDHDLPANAGVAYAGKCTSPNGGIYYVLVRDLSPPTNEETENDSEEAAGGTAYGKAK